MNNCVESIYKTQKTRRKVLLSATCFCSFFGRNWRQQTGISKLIDLLSHFKNKKVLSFFCSLLRKTQVYANWRNIMKMIVYKNKDATSEKFSLFCVTCVGKTCKKSWHSFTTLLEIFLRTCIMQNRVHMRIGLVFCFQNCSYLLWDKIVLVLEKIFWDQ